VRALVLLLLPATLLAASLRAPPSDDIPEAALRTLQRSAVEVGWETEKVRSRCSGVLIQGKHVLTSAHCIGCQTNVTVWLPLGNESVKAPGRVRHVDDGLDVALISLVDPPFKVHAAPWATDLPQRGAALTRWGRTTGFRRGTYARLGDPFDSAHMISRSGDSGGPLVNDAGELVGILHGGSRPFALDEPAVAYAGLTSIHTLLEEAQSAPPVTRDELCAAPRLVWTHYGDALDRNHAGDDLGAIRSLSFALQLVAHPGFRLRLLRMRGFAFYNRGQLAEAAADASAILAAAPEHREATTLSALLESAAGEREAAIKRLEDWQTRNYQDGWLVRTAEWIQAGNEAPKLTQEAREPDMKLQATCLATLATADDATLDGCLAEALLGSSGGAVDRRLFPMLGDLLGKRGRAEDAVQLWEAARTLDPDHAEVTFRLGWARLATGDVEAALQLFDQLHARAARNPLFLYLDGAALGAAGQLADALQQLDAAVSLVPDFAHARALRDHLAGGGGVGAVGLDGTVELLPPEPAKP